MVSSARNFDCQQTIHKGNWHVEFGMYFGRNVQRKTAVSRLLHNKSGKKLNVECKMFNFLNDFPLLLCFALLCLCADWVYSVGIASAQRKRFEICRKWFRFDAFKSINKIDQLESKYGGIIGWCTERCKWLNSSTSRYGSKQTTYS